MTDTPRQPCNCRSVEECPHKFSGVSQEMAGVTGNEGKDMQNYGSRESQEGALKEEAPLASPAVVTAKHFFDHDWMSHARHIKRTKGDLAPAELLKSIAEAYAANLRAKVSELEAQLQLPSISPKSGRLE